MLASTTRSIRTTRSDPGPTTIWVDTVDGQRIQLHTLQQVQAYADRAQNLTVTVLRSSEATAMCALLNQTAMHQLKGLALDYDPYPMSEATTAPLGIVLPPQHYPSLQNIALGNAVVQLTPSLATHLRFLMMGAVNGPSAGLPLVPFLASLRECKHIQGLALHNCFTPPADRSPGARNPLNALELTRLDIMDHPTVIRWILSALLVPEVARVVIQGKMRNIQSPSFQDGCDALLSLLPGDRNHLPVLGSCKQILVMNTMTQCCVAGFLDPQDNPQPCTSSVCLQLDHVYLGDPSPVARSSRATIVGSGIICRLNEIFPQGKVTHAAFVGDLDAITTTTTSWIMVLSQHPTIRHLSVVGEPHRRFPEPQFKALLTLGSPHPRVPWPPHLDSLKLSGDFQGEAYMQTVCSSAQSYVGTAGRLRVRNLKIVHYNQQPWSSGLAERCRRLFSPFAEQSSSFQVVNPP